MVRAEGGERGDNRGQGGDLLEAEQHLDSRLLHDERQGGPGGRARSEAETQRGAALSLLSPAT